MEILKPTYFKYGLIVFLTIYVLCCMLSPSFCELFYFQTFFQVIRVIHDYTLAYLPIPNIYIAFLILFYFLFKAIYRLIKDKKWLAFIKSIGMILLFLLFFFYLSWGLNYSKPNLQTRLGMDISQIPDFEISERLREQTNILNQIGRDILSIEDFSNVDYENEIRFELEKLLQQWSIPSFGRVRVRGLPGGTLLHIRTSGIYIPHAFEGHYDSGLYDVQWPATMAHEMAHGYGFTDESVCNFIAYLVCLASDDPRLKYSGHLSYWRYLARNTSDRNIVIEEKKLLLPVVQDDLIKIREHVIQYKEWFADSREVIYDQYLKSHGVEAGIESYDQMVLLIEWYRIYQLEKTSVQ